MIEELETLATAIIWATTSNPVTAILGGVIAGIFGKTLIDKKKATKKEKAERKKKLEDLMNVNLKGSDNDSI